MAEKGVGSGDRGIWIAAIVAIVAVGLLVICVVIAAVGLLGIGLFGVRSGSGPSAPIVVVQTPTALP